MKLSSDNLVKLNRGPRTLNFSRKPLDFDAARFETQAHIQDVCIWYCICVCVEYIRSETSRLLICSGQISTLSTWQMSNHARSICASSERICLKKEFLIFHCLWKPVQSYVYAIGNYLPGFKIVYGVYELNQFSTVSELAKDTKYIKIICQTLLDRHVPFFESTDCKKESNSLPRSLL